jgi:hypothetical protein
VINRKKRSPSNRKPVFARDEPVYDLESADAFGHAAHSIALADAILASEPPVTIGLFGEWGVGKTTITSSYLEKTLRRRAGEAGKSLAYAYFDVWKYEDDSLRRQLLRDVASDLKGSGDLVAAYKPESKLRDLAWDVTETLDLSVGFSWRRFLVAFGAAAAGTLALLLLIRFAELDLQNELFIVVFTAFIVAIGRELRGVVVVRQQQLTKRSLDAPDLFETKFKELMKAVKAELLVIVIDNLDRCSPDRMLEVLATIKTFLEPANAEVQPIFVIPCSDRTLKDQLREAAKLRPADAEEFLRKFFSLTIRITPILEDEMREYVRSQIDALALADEFTDQGSVNLLVQVVAVAFRDNPRRVKQFLNTMSAKLALIRERERTGAIRPAISGEVPFLAKITALEEKWPLFYEELRRDPRTLAVAADLAMGLVDPATATLNTDFSEDSSLIAFLRGTRRVESENLRAFLRLKLSEMELELSDYEEFRAALVDGRFEDVRRIIGAESDDS